MTRALAATAVVLASIAALSGCGTCCYCYCGEVPVRNLLEANVNVTRPEVTPDGKVVAVAVRY